MIIRMIPIYNASGARCTTFKELQELDSSDSSYVLSKSCTLEAREGNPGKRYWENSDISINSTGLANLGYEKYLEFEFNKPYIVSVAGLTLDDNLTIIRAIQDTEINSIELNLSCPNIKGKPEVAYDFDASEEYLRKIFEFNEIPLGLKLPPYPNDFYWGCMADVIKEFSVKFVTCINSPGNCIVIDPLTDLPVIEPNGGHGGMGGKYVLPIALANVKKFRQLLPNRIDIIGCGGISTGQDVYHHMLCGASAVQVGTAFMKEGVGIFTKLKNELEIIMKETNGL
jgi:dihydroorotate dehydrogenase (fumarate)